MARKDSKNEQDVEGQDPVLDNDEAAQERQEEQERLRARGAPGPIVEGADRQSDPMGVDAEGGVTTNEEGDPPGDELEQRERKELPYREPKKSPKSDS